MIRVDTNTIIGIGGLRGEIQQMDNRGNNTQLREIVQEGIDKGNTKTFKVDKEGRVHETNGLNNISNAAIDITV